MKKLAILTIALLVLTSYINLQAQTKAADPKAPVKHGKNFVDKNGDGYNDLAPDHDGDGIPNGLDPDYKGSQMQKGKKGFIDLNGDGINDNAGMRKGKAGKGGFGPANGCGNKGVGPKDGTGNGFGAKNGLHDGTGSKTGGKGGNK